MKKLVLLIGLGFFFNFGQAQFLDSADLEEFYSQNGNNDLGVSFPVLVLKNEEQFDSVRLAIHIGYENFKYKVYYYDSLENISNVEIMDINRVPSGDFEIQDRSFALLDKNGKFLKLIYIDPNL